MARRLEFIPDSTCSGADAGSRCRPLRFRRALLPERRRSRSPCVEGRMSASARRRRRSSCASSRFSLALRHRSCAGWQNACPTWWSSTARSCDGEVPFARLHRAEVALRAVESRKLGDVPLDDVSAEHHLEPALHEVPARPTPTSSSGTADAARTQATMPAPARRVLTRLYSPALVQDDRARSASTRSMRRRPGITCTSRASTSSTASAASPAASAATTRPAIARTIAGARGRARLPCGCRRAARSRSPGLEHIAARGQRRLRRRERPALACRAVSRGTTSSPSRAASAARRSSRSPAPPTPHYKTRLDPLYADVIYVDPFAPNAIAEIDARPRGSTRSPSCRSS